MIRQMVKLAVEAFLVELDRWADPTPPSASAPKPSAKAAAGVATDEKSAPWNMVQEVAPAPKRRRRKAAAS